MTKPLVDMTENEIRAELARIAALPPDQMTHGDASLSLSLKSSLSMFDLARKPPEGSDA